MGITKKDRFEVFKRDGFKCQYCGATPPNAILEVDHINPKSKGGDDDINNLITACFDCNRGKSNRDLDVIPHSLADNMAEIEEKELQLKEYNKVLGKKKARITRTINKIDEIYTSYFESWCLSDKFKNGTLRTFIKLLPEIEIADAMHIACSRINDDNKSIKYFCGICWNKINSRD